MDLEYDANVKEIFICIVDMIDNSEYDVDIDEMLDSVLVINLEDDVSFTVTKHESTKAVWLASTHSGVYHFYFKSGNWIDNNGQEICSVIKNDLEACE